MYKVLVLLFLVSGAQSVSFFDLVHEQWETFKLTYKKSYDNPTEETYRMKIFMENYHNIVKNNQLYEQGLITYKSKLNKWADKLHYEFVQTLNGFNRSLSTGYDIKTDDGAAKFIPAANVELPDQVDWRQNGAVTPVKDQGDCGSCWAFSTTGSLEGQTFRKTGKLISLSEQNLLDCSDSYGNYACYGGLMINAFEYIRDNNGLDTEEYYPYEATDGVCRYNSAYSGATIKSYSIIDPESEEDLESAVATVGPISVAIDASLDSFHFYSEGIYYEPLCSSTNLDHAVLVVGYGSEGGKDYWLVKNSWGTTWGDGGYIKMARNMENNCGIATLGSYPLV